MFARFDENQAMTLQDNKETKRYARTDARTDGQHKNSIPTTNKVCGGYKFHPPQTQFAGGIMNKNPCSNQEIHMLFEHGFELENT